MKLSKQVKQQEKLIRAYEQALTDIVKRGGICEGSAKEGCPYCIAEKALLKKPAEIEQINHSLLDAAVMMVHLNTDLNNRLSR